MTISKTSNKITHVANGSNKVFTFDFRIDSENDVEIYYDGVLQSPTPLFSIPVLELGKEAGGTLTFDTAPPACDLTIYRKMDLIQSVDYTAYGAFAAETHENALDKLIMITQQQQEQIDRAWLQDVLNEGPTVVDGSFYFGNNKGIYGEKTTTVDTLLIKMNNYDQVEIGEVSFPVYIPGGVTVAPGASLKLGPSVYIQSSLAGSDMYLYVGNQAVALLYSTDFNFLKIAYFSENIVFSANNKFLWGTKAGGGTQSIIGLDASNEVVIGGNQIPVNFPGADDWSGGPLKLGNYHIWVDLSGNLRIKSGAPAFDGDGVKVGSQ